MKTKSTPVRYVVSLSKEFPTKGVGNAIIADGTNDAEVDKFVDKWLKNENRVLVMNVEELTKLVPPEPTLKIGNFVRVISIHDDLDIIGYEGEVVEVFDEGRITKVSFGLVGVKFAAFKAKMHTLDGKTATGHGWRFPYCDNGKALWPKYLELLP